MSSTIALIGAGNMGRSLLGGMIKKGFHPEQIWVAEPSEEKLSEIKQTFNVNVSSDNLTAIEKADAIILAVKPQMMSQVATEIKNQVATKKPMLLSIAAGLAIQNFETWFGKNIPIVRSMPNTAALIGCGASALFANPNVNSENKSLAENILKAVGIALWVEKESDLDTVTSLSGNGPAYFFLVVEALENAAIKLGLEKNLAHQLAKQTAYGASRLLLETEESADSLRKKVTSPGGTTEQAIKVLEENHIRDIFYQALKASNTHAQHLAKKG